MIGAMASGFACKNPNRPIEKSRREIIGKFYKGAPPTDYRPGAVGMFISSVPQDSISPTAPTPSFPVRLQWILHNLNLRIDFDPIDIAREIL
jgi:hypothetical protein